MKSPWKADDLFFESDKILVLGPGEIPDTVSVRIKRVTGQVYRRSVGISEFSPLIRNTMTTKQIADSRATLRRGNGYLAFV